MSIRMAIFVYGNVGLEIGRFFRKNQESISCLILDSKDGSNLNKEIISVFNVDPNNIIMSNDLYSPETIEKLKKYQLDLGILVWWPYIIKDPIITLPRLGILNFHPSLLPYNRGKHYYFWTFLENSPFGVTIHFVDKGVDTGDIAFQNQIGKTWEDNAKTLFEKAQKSIVNLFIQSFSRIKNGDIPRSPQDLSIGSFHFANELEAASLIKLDKKYTARELLNLLRARTFPPYGAWFEDEGKRYRVRVEIEQLEGNQ